VFLPTPTHTFQQITTLWMAPKQVVAKTYRLHQSIVPQTPSTDASHQPDHASFGIASAALVTMPCLLPATAQLLQNHLPMVQAQIMTQARTQ
jgi:hypothetical protein